MYFSYISNAPQGICPRNLEASKWTLDLQKIELLKRGKILLEATFFFRFKCKTFGGVHNEKSHDGLPSEQVTFMS